jgi:hypothetical protein
VTCSHTCGHTLCIGTFAGTQTIPPFSRLHALAACRYRGDCSCVIHAIHTPNSTSPDDCKLTGQDCTVLWWSTLGQCKAIAAINLGVGAADIPFTFSTVGLPPSSSRTVTAVYVSPPPFVHTARWLALVNIALRLAPQPLSGTNETYAANKNAACVSFMCVTFSVYCCLFVWFHELFTLKINTPHICKHT